MPDVCTSVTLPSHTDVDGDGYGNACDDDFNDDCIVDSLDLGIFRAIFFTADAPADLNGDGIVHPVGLGISRALFFAPRAPSGVPIVCDQALRPRRIFRASVSTTWRACIVTPPGTVTVAARGHSVVGLRLPTIFTIRATGFWN